MHIISFVIAKFLDPATLNILSAGFVLLLIEENNLIFFFCHLLLSSYVIGLAKEVLCLQTFVQHVIINLCLFIPFAFCFYFVLITRFLMLFLFLTIAHIFILLNTFFHLV